MSFVILLGWAFSVLFSFLAFNQVSKLKQEIATMKSQMQCANTDN